ncbi:dipicolinate synthase subunit DpsA [Cellulosilyticum ruminicola]|uniref:dipicolinate synthase subunit DpsA n=1 Tax=Cellulosilyticum ruminicola TaxID=425254 RepID=UPI0006D15921|nr:dipicolinate synthase subunit DpsA [Cellulosilyticum ruminicola]
MSQISVAIVGGDLRFVRLSQILCDQNFNVLIYGLSHPDIPRSAHICTSIDELKDVPYIIGPIPFSKDNTCVFTPLCNTYIPLEQFFRVASNSFVLGSVLTSNLVEAFETHHIRYCDIMKMNEIAILNAIPTAEGAIQYAMQHSEITLHNSRCLVLGFGRCGKILAYKLQSLGTKVAVEARSTTDIAFISTYGYEAVPLNELKTHLGNFDFIFNTIPVVILNKEEIDAFNPEVVYIELASVPGGIDINYCHERGIVHVPAPSLPGIVAPKSAAAIIYQCLLLILRNQGASL